MGSSNSIKKEIPIKVLKEFKEYEDKIYSELSPTNMELQDNLDFYLVPKKYISDFNEYFDYYKNICNLDLLNLFLKAVNNDENIVITKNIIKNLKKFKQHIYDYGIKFKKISNKILIDKTVDYDKYIFRTDKEEGLFVPLTYEIWHRFEKHYKCDIELKRRGFINHGEIFIITEDTRLDTYFNHRRTLDIIYHFCLIIEDIFKFNKLVKYLKYNSVKHFFDIIEIKHVGEEINSEKFIKKEIVIPSFIKELGNYTITVIYLDSYDFHGLNRNFTYFTKEDTLKSILILDDNNYNNNNLNNNISNNSSYNNHSNLNSFNYINNLNYNQISDNINQNDNNKKQYNNQHNNEDIANDGYKNLEIKNNYHSSENINFSIYENIQKSENEKSITNKNLNNYSIQSNNIENNNAPEQSKIEYSNHHANISMGYKSFLHSCSEKNSINGE